MKLKNLMLAFTMLSIIAAVPALAATETHSVSTQSVPTRSVLTLDDCIASAVEHHPDVEAAVQKTEAERAAIRTAQADGNTKLSATAGYTRGGTGWSSDNNDGSFKGGVTATQLITDWGRTDAKVHSARLSTEAVSADFRQTRQKVIKNVYSAYYNLNKAVRENEATETRYNNFKKRLDWAKAYYSAGTKAKIEVTKAEADVASSKLAVVKTHSSIELYKSELANTMGTPSLQIGKVKDMLGASEWKTPLDDVLKTAFAQRPELEAKRKRVDAAKTNLTLQMKGLSPSLSASAGYDIGGTSPFSFDDNQWNAKVSMTIPIVDGGLTKSKVDQARAQLRQAQAEYESLRNSIDLAVRQAWQSLIAADEALISAMEAERSAKETLDLANGRYAAGVGDSLEISDAVNSYATASISRITAMYNCKTAQLDLTDAMGGLTYDK